MKTTKMEKMKNLIKTSFMIGMFLIAATSKIYASTSIFTGKNISQELRVSSKTGWYSEGSTLVHRFDRATYVERLLISAEGLRSFSTATVYADGDQIALLGVPGKDPDYPVIVRKLVTNITVKFQGKIKISDFRIFGCENVSNPFDLISGDSNSIEGLAEMAMGVVAALQDVEGYEDFTTYLLPVRKAALKMGASAGGRPEHSNKTFNRVAVLVNAITAAEAHLDSLLEREFYVDYVQTLMFVRERLEAMYEM